MELKQRFKTILKNLNEGIYEKEEVIALAFLSAISGESIFLLGPPGVAKSLIARRLKNIFKDGKAFEYLMSRFSTPDEIFGPVSISKLKNEDKYVRLTQNYLPNADIVFLDEIWKAGPSIQNTLLTVINEKVFRNGDKDEKVKMKSLISASNELPAQNEGLEALWDRFLIRYFVDGITDSDKFFEMIDGNASIDDDNIDEKLKITDEEYQKWQKDIQAIKLPDEVKNTIKAIRFYLEEYNKNLKSYIYISDRRWKKIVKILKTSAFMNDRKEINLMDVFLIVHLIWNDETQRNLVKEMVAKAVKEHSFSENLRVDEINLNYSELEDDIEHELKTNTKREEKNELYEEEYYIVDDPKGELRDGYKYIRKDEFDSASINSSGEYLYDSNGNYYYNSWDRKYYQWRKKGKNKIKYDYNNKEYPLKIETFIKKTKIHPVLIDKWNESVDGLKNKIETTVSNFRKIYEELDEKLENYLILDENLKRIPKLNIENSIDELNKKKLELEKLKKKYIDFNNSVKS